MKAEARPDPGRVLSKAVLRAAQALGMRNRDLAEVLGCSGATVSRMARGRPVQVGTKEGELALLVVRLYRSLDAMVGGDDAAAARWFRADNRALGGPPAERVKSIEGLVRVVEYLDAMRGKL
ncbi:MAG: MbcA/ParS/Xre antitoxin family protein [Myxococcota bacterium]